jgi:tetratricopeptide (TPR) repeat protein
LDPKFVQAYYSRGFVYNRLGQPLRATEDFNRAILLDPDVAEGYLGRGEAHAVLKQIPQAIENYGEANQA